MAGSAAQRMVVTGTRVTRQFIRVCRQAPSPDHFTGCPIRLGRHQPLTERGNTGGMLLTTALRAVPSKDNPPRPFERLTEPRHPHSSRSPRLGIIQAAILWSALLLLPGCDRENADAPPAAPAVREDSLPVIKVSGHGGGLGKEDQAVGDPLEISAKALYGKWEWNEPGKVSITLGFRDILDFAHTYNSQGKRVGNPDGRVSLLVTVLDASELAPELAWGLDISNRRGWVADAKDEIGPPGPERSAEIRLVRSDLLHIKGRLPATIANIEFDGFLVKVPGNGIEDLPDLVARLGSDRPKDIRIAAAKRLYVANDPPVKETVPILVEWLKESDAEIRFVALEALFVVLMPTKGPCPLAVVKALFDKDKNVRNMAANCLDYRPLPEEAMPLLLKAIEHDDYYVQCKALDAILDTTHDFDLVVPRWFRAIKRSQDAMDAGLLDREELRAWAEGIKCGAVNAAMRLHYLGRENPSDLGKCLIKLLSDKSPGIRLAAARSLGAIAGDNANSKEVLRVLNAHDAVEKLLDDPDPSVVATAQAALAKLK